MKFNRYINESSMGTPFDEIIKMLLKDCGPFMKDLSRGFTSEFLISGRNDSRDYFIKDIRTDREPKDMIPIAHDFIDTEFNKRFGFKARSNALFVTGSYSLAIGYGKPYLIFPIGNYKFVYSNSVTDMFMDIDKFISPDKFKEEMSGTVGGERRHEIEKEWEVNYKEGSINGSWEYDDGYIFFPELKERSKASAMMEVKRYLLRDKRYIKSSEADRKKLEDSISSDYIRWIPDLTKEEYIDEYSDNINKAEINMGYDDWAEEKLDVWLTDNIGSYKTHDINKAIASKREIMLNCKKYYAISYKDYQAALTLYIKSFKDRMIDDEKIKDWYMKNNGKLPKQLKLFRDMER